MLPSFQRYRPWLEAALPWVVLLVLLFYTHSEIVDAPYIGFAFSPTNGRILEVTEVPPRSPSLQADDRLIQIGHVTWADYLADLRHPLFADMAPGQILVVTVDRAGELLSIPWRVPGPTWRQVLGRVINLWGLAYIFWLMGTATVMLVRPRDTRWRLLVAFYFITALWLIAGNTSRWHLSESAILFRMAIWLAVPVYLHLHWSFPRPLRPLPRWLVVGLYGLCVGLAGLQAGQLIPSNLYLMGFLLAISGSVLLLALHFIYQPQERSKVRVVFAAVALAFIPVIALSIAQLYQAIPTGGPAALLALPLIPGAYFYLTYRNLMDQMELRINRLIALYIFLLLLCTSSLMLVPLATLFITMGDKVVLIGVASTLLATLITAFGLVPFQRLIESRLFGIQTSSLPLLEVYARRITTSLDRAHLMQILHTEMLPSLFIRQSVLLQFQAGDAYTVLYTQGVTAHHLPSEIECQALLTEAGHYRVPTDDATAAQLCPWVRLVLVLKEQNEARGLWLLGRRDPDDFYAEAEIATLQALANQTAIALTTLRQAEQLQLFYQANIDRHELERTHLAHVLHDEVLNKLAVLALNSPDLNPSPAFDDAYRALTKGLRQLITGLRPTMMNYGLYAALAELIEDLNERVGAGPIIWLELAETPVRYALRVEEALFRIVQQACENALRHAQAKLIRIHGQLEPEAISLIVEDNGVGFAGAQALDLAGLLAQKHFGLVGMHERAALIAATLQIHSHLGQGTQIRIQWQSAQTISPAAQTS